MSIIPPKPCRRCGVVKLIAEFSPNPTSLDGYFNQCKLCVRYRRVPDDEYFANINKGLRRCSKCKAWKSIDQFVVCKQRTDGIAPHCLECHRSVSNDYARRNSKKNTAASNIWRRNNRDRVLLNQRTKRALNPEPQRERSRKWQKLNLDKVKINYHRRRARIRSNGGEYTVTEWRDLCAKYGNCCLCCGRGGKLTVDHIVPIALGGLNTIDNLQPLCRPCNSSKRLKIIDFRPAIDSEV